MNKKESNIILNTYKEIYRIHEVVKIDKADTIRELKIMIDALGMKKERYIIENEVIAERDNIKYSSLQMYEMIFNNFLKYGKYIHYDLDEIDVYYDDLQFRMTEEENKCYTAQVNYIESHKAA